MDSNWRYSPETLNSGQNRRYFLPCDLEIWSMTLKNDRPPFQCYFKICASFHSRHWIQTGVTVRKLPIRVKIGDFFVPCDLEIWQMTLKNNRVPPLCYFKLCASFRNRSWLQTGVTVRIYPIWVKINDFFVPYDFEIWRLDIPNLSQNQQFFVPYDLDIWRMTLQYNRAAFLSHIKLCASFHRHMLIQTGVTVRKLLNWVLTAVTFTFDLWPWPSALHGHHFYHG